MAEAIVTLPDGRKARIKGPTRQAVEAKARELAGASKATPGSNFTTGLTGGMAERLIDNTLGIPESVARAGQGALNVGRGVLGMDPMLRQPGENILGLPSGRDVLSAAQAAPGILSGDFSERYQGAQNQRDQIAQENQFASDLGGVLGDTATLMTMRAPMARGMPAAGPQAAQGAMRPPLSAKPQGYGGLFDEPIRQGMEKLARATSGKSAGIKSATNSVLNSPGFQHFARGAGRVGETSMEAAILSTIQGGDPVETAALAAGGQTLGSLGLTMAKESFEWPKYLGLAPKGPLGKAASLVVGAGVLGGLAQMLKSIAPGGLDRILESEEFGYNKIIFNVLLGGLAGAATGAKRTKVDGVLSAFPRFGDAIATLPRAGMINMAKAIADDPQLESGVNKMVADPTAYSEEQWMRFGELLESKNPSESFSKWLEEDKDMREKLSAPPGLAGVPLKD